MRAELHHPLVDNSDLVCVLDGGHSVSDRHRGAWLLYVELVEGGLDNLQWLRERDRQTDTQTHRERGRERERERGGGGGRAVHGTAEFVVISE